MKNIMLLTILLFTYGCFQQTPSPAVRTPLPENDFLIIAHRGASAYTTGHTLAAYEMAVQMGADYIEIDLQMTKDGKLVALHDSVVTLHDVKQAVADVTFDDIQLHSPGQELVKNPLSYAFPNFSDLRIVDLSEILDHFGDSVNYYIEIKSPKMYPGIEKELLLQLGEHHLLNKEDITPKVIIQSFDADSLKEIHALDPSIPLTQLYKFGKKAKLSKKALKELSQYASGVGVNVHAVNRDFIEAIHKKGLLVLPYTINDENTMRQLMKLGVNGIFTDRPDVASRVKNEQSSLDQ
ncbi:glycerophosphodiester phosphodiesterase family protein [Paenisporosarcina indica]|uniref:glycerophosphodiester phosphodiesterase family protein n=1 Tax=Paenisporosarcina indica TaxID=650093 RepID=UPI00094F4C89|nr:glycerophosphodiester phosphodiesterase family protein [Paenisporosarcina indica]